PGSGRISSYAELTRGQQLTKTILEEPLVTVPEKWKVAGHSAAKVSGRDFVTGEHKYTSDLTLPGMLQGRVLRPTAFHGKLISCDPSGAESIPGVTALRDGDFVGVAAPDKLTAERAATAIRAQWDAPTQPSESDLFSYLKKQAQEPEDDDRITTGSIE